MKKAQETSAIDKLRQELGRYIKKTEDQEAVIKALRNDNKGLLDSLKIAAAYVSYLFAVPCSTKIMIPKAEIARRLGAVSVRARDAGDNYEVELVESLGDKQ